MSALRLYGTTTSPYVRRVRVVANELGVETELVDVSTDAGHKELRSLSPVWKVPCAQLEGQLMLDSATITTHLLNVRGPGPLAVYSPTAINTHNIMTAIDGALDALINILYLGRDGLGVESSAYLSKQRARAEHAMAWLEGQVRGPWLTPVERFGLPEIALCTTLDWMGFRDAYDYSKHRGLVACLEAHAGRPSLQGTPPTVSARS